MRHFFSVIIFFCSLTCYVYSETVKVQTANMVRDIDGNIVNCTATPEKVFMHQDGCNFCQCIKSGVIDCSFINCPPSFWEKFWNKIRLGIAKYYQPVPVMYK